MCLTILKQLIIVLILVLGCGTIYGQVKNPQDDGRIIKIPIVFHVIYSSRIQNISDELILKELKDLNLNLSGKNDMSVLEQSVRNLVGTANFEFILLDTMLQHSGAKAIQRIENTATIDRENILINAKLCLNVFIADQGNASDILGDRVNLNFEDVGMNNHVLTHETGHWLGLYHVWGKTGSCSRIKLIFLSHDDEVDDTPLQWKCTDVKFLKPCPPSKVRTYKGKKAMYNNFMDYSSCRCMFTIGQIVKMRNNVIESKGALFLKSH